MSKNYDLILFDFDGTLLNTEPAIVHCMSKAMYESNLGAPSIDLIRSTIGLRLDEVFIRLGVEQDRVDELIKAYRAIYSQEGPELSVIYSGVDSLLEKLNDAGVKIVITSNKGKEAIIQTLKTFGLSDYVEDILADSDGLPKKPDPSIVNDYVLTKYPTIQRERCLVVGDTTVDIQFAKNSCVDSCWVSYGFGDPAQCEALSPTYTASTVDQVWSIVNEVAFV